LARVTWTPLARRDLAAITAYIAQDSPEYAPQFARKIAEAARRLADFPLSGRRVPELDLERLREVVFHNYRIIYEPRAEGVVILGVIHGAMDFSAMAEQRDWNLS
jgi:toxin ParE1/3/4